jgi:hypothetical protein
VIESDAVDLIRRYPRPIAHMRQLVKKRKLGLALGAGVSRSAKLPDWIKLLGKIGAKIEQLQGTPGANITTQSAPMQAQILLSRYRQYRETQGDLANIEASHREAVVASDWRSLVRDALYERVTDPQKPLDQTTIKQEVDNHEYLSNLARLARQVPIVVNYNFDDLLERALASNPPPDTLGYYPAWGPTLVVQDDRPVVYHPNGYVPFDLAERCSEQIVLTEEAISDQIIDSFAGSYQLLLDYYSRSSCLFLGFSLADAGLRSMLRQSARRSPGTVHYYIRYADSNSSIDEKAEATNANFELFNMITLYLDSSDIATLLRLIAEVGDDELNDYFFKADAPTEYFYCLAGPVSVGKTSAISMLQGVDIVDEWLRPRLPLIAKPSSELSPDERRRVDDWIIEQLRLKNARFEKAKVGIHVMDRAPLDAFAFTPTDQRTQKAETIHKIACHYGNRVHEFVDACLLLLTGQPSELSVRQKWRGRGGGPEYIRKQQEVLLETYCCPGNSGARIVNTEGKELRAVVKDVVRVMYLEPYNAFKFSNRLAEFRENGP